MPTAFGDTLATSSACATPASVAAETVPAAANAALPAVILCNSSRRVISIVSLLTRCTVWFARSWFIWDGGNWDGFWQPLSTYQSGTADCAGRQTNQCGRSSLKLTVRGKNGRV